MYFMVMQICSKFISWVGMFKHVSSHPPKYLVDAHCDNRAFLQGACSQVLIGELKCSFYGLLLKLYYLMELLRKQYFPEIINNHFRFSIYPVDSRYTEWVQGNITIRPLNWLSLKGHVCMELTLHFGIFPSTQTRWVLPNNIFATFADLIWYPYVFVIVIWKSK